MLKAWVKQVVVLGVLASTTSGCIMYRLEELRNTTPQGTPFQTALSRMYMDFAAKEEKEYDWQDSWYFADKGLKLAYGRDADPEELDGWNLDESGKLELEKARIRVMDVLTPALKASSPNRAAAIEFYFDCWVEQQEEGWQQDDIAFCRDNLMRSLNGMGESEARPMPIAHADAPQMSKTKTTKWAKPNEFKAPKGEAVEKTQNVTPEKAKATKPEAAAKAAAASETASYAVFFDAGKPDVSGPGKNVLNEVVTSLKGKADYLVVLHVSAPGSAAATEKDLPAKRLAVVKKVLTDGGVDSSAIVNADGPEAAKPVARRVELFLNE